MDLHEFAADHRHGQKAQKYHTQQVEGMLYEPGKMYRRSLRMRNLAQEGDVKVFTCEGASAVQTNGSQKDVTPIRDSVTLRQAVLHESNCLLSATRIRGGQKFHHNTADATSQHWTVETVVQESC
jgi:hypothetical protein